MYIVLTTTGNNNHIFLVKKKNNYNNNNVLNPQHKANNSLFKGFGLLCLRLDIAEFPPRFTQNKNNKR